jgi:hypothetical protein
MCTFCPHKNTYEIAEVNLANETIGKHQFYQEYLSKSMPVILRNGAKDWGFYKGIEEKSKYALDDFLAKEFENTI